MDEVTWRSYKEHMEIQDFEEIFSYSSWIMCGEKVYGHLLERVKRQYGYVLDIPRPPTDVVQMQDTHIVQAFIDFRTHTIKEDNWGNSAGEMPWRMDDGYMLWYTRVSHPHTFPPISRYPQRPANEEQIIAHQWEQHQARGSLIPMIWLVTL
jgi:hypothetical protein